MIIGTRENPVRFSFVQVWEPRSVEDGQAPKYSVQVIVPKTDKAAIKALQDGVAKAAQLGISKGLFNKAVTENPAFRQPLRDGDQEAAENDGSRDYLKGCVFFNASAAQDRQPAIVDRFCKPILRRDEFYSGCYGIADINFFPFKFGKGGVAAGLNSIMKRDDGDRLDGRLSVEQAFGSVADEEGDGTQLT